MTRPEPKVRNERYLADLRQRHDNVWGQIKQLRRIEAGADNPERATSYRIKWLELELIAKKIAALIEEEEELDPAS